LSIEFHSLAATLNICQAKKTPEENPFQGVHQRTQSNIQRNGERSYYGGVNVVSCLLSAFIRSTFLCRR